MESGIELDSLAQNGSHDNGFSAEQGESGIAVAPYVNNELSDSEEIAVVADSEEVHTHLENTRCGVTFCEEESLASSGNTELCNKAAGVISKPTLKRYPLAENVLPPIIRPWWKGDE